MPDSQPPLSKPHSTAKSGTTAVLFSGGLDSTVLLTELLAAGGLAQPLYIRCGLCWEDEEIVHARRVLAAMQCPALGPLVVLDVPVADLYGDHWAITGRGVPDGASRDEAVFLPGRNVLLLSKAALWCHLHAAPTLAIATLRANPFADATPEFIAALEAVVNRAVGGSVHIVQPLASLNKQEVLIRGVDAPLGQTLSCLVPRAGRHCGRCNKCTERRLAFHRAGLKDSAQYDTNANEAT